MREPYAVKVARTVLRGLEAGNGLRLLDLSCPGAGLWKKEEEQYFY